MEPEHNQEQEQKREERTPDHERFFTSPRDFFRQMFNLQEGLDTEKTIHFIRENDEMVHANSWLLMASIFICAIGLDLNSPAIIIGGMLIAPLMAPILGIGLSIAINDRKTLFITIRHYIAAAVFSILASLLYFWLNPLGVQVPTEQIMSRTEPTVLDGLVAVFGGIAGIISVSHPEKSTAIPGVAIAIALMPPLCVVGYGLANADWTVFGGAFYLFFINSFFVALSSFALVRYMRFPFKEYVNKKERRKTLRIIGFVSLLILLPSAYILFTIYQKNVNESSARSFVSEYFGKRDNPRAIDWEYIRQDGDNRLLIELLGSPVGAAQRDSFQELLKEYKLGDTRLDLIQGSEIELQKLKTNVQDITALMDELYERQKERTDLRKEMDDIKARLQEALSSPDTSELKQELLYLYPELSDFRILADSSSGLPLRIHLKWKEDSSPSMQAEQREQIRRFLKISLKKDSFVIED